MSIDLFIQIILAGVAISFIGEYVYQTINRYPIESGLIDDSEDMFD